MLLLICFILSLFFQSSHGDVASCIASCDNNVTLQTGNAITICGSDLVTHETYQNLYSGSNSCYLKCGVGLYHVGPCGCPNWCYNDIGHGNCNNSICKCGSGWGGADCSSVLCPNSCSGHGVCQQTEGIDSCECEEGYTGNDCSVEVDSSLSNPLPYGQIVSGKYYKDDKYGDKHPVFRPNLLATIKMYINTSDLLYCLYPQNLYNESYVYGDFFFNNGIETTRMANVGIRVKGAVSRSDPKKSWSIKFNTEKGREWKKLKGLGLKNAAGASVVSNQLTVEFYRSMLVQTYRTSFAEFWINDIFMGLYTVQEKFDDNFLDSRYNLKKKNNYLYKIGWYDLSYLGTNVTVYSQDLVYAFDQLNPIQRIAQSEGDGNWTSFIDLVYNLNQSVVSTDFFDIDSFLRAMTLEAYIQNMDGYNGIGNNYFIANSKNNGPVWQFIAQDFDFAMFDISSFFFGGGGGMPNNTGNFANNTDNNNNNNSTNNGGKGFFPNFGTGGFSNNIFQFQSPIKPLTRAVFSSPGANETYAMYTEMFINATKDAIHDRIDSYARLASASLAKDKLYSSARGQNITTFWAGVAVIKTWASNRADNVTSQLAAAVFPTSAPEISSSSFDESSESSSDAPASSTSDEKKESSNTGIVVGVIFGVLIVGAVIVAFVYFKFIRPKNAHKRMLLDDDDELNL